MKPTDGIDLPEETGSKKLGGFCFPVSEYHVYSWCPNDQGINPEQVHISLHLTGFEHPLVLRLMTADAVDTLVAALRRHQREVWPQHIIRGES